MIHKLEMMIVLKNGHKKGNEENEEFQKDYSVVSIKMN